MDNMSYFLAAYAVIWIGVFGYLFHIHRKQKGLRKELDSIRREMEGK